MMTNNTPLQEKERVAQQFSMMPLPPNPRPEDQRKDKLLDGYLTALFGLSNTGIEVEK